MHGNFWFPLDAGEVKTYEFFLNIAWNLTRKSSLKDKISGEKFELRLIGLEDRGETGSRISYRVWIPGNMLANAKRGGFLREYEYSEPQREE